MKTHKYLGMDVHQDDSVVGVAEEGRGGAEYVYGEISSDLHAVDRMIAKLGGPEVTLHVAYEAGPTGFGLYRHLRARGIDCVVVAPSCTPEPKGGRQKTIAGMPCNWRGCTGRGA